MKSLNTLIYLFLLIYGALNLQAQNSCEEIFYSLDEIETLASFSTANGPASFKKKVELSPTNEILRGCESYQAEAWKDISTETNPDLDSTGANQQNQFFLIKWIRSLFKSKKVKKVSYQADMKTAFLITTYGYTAQVDTQEVKKFVHSEPWHRGLDYSSHLAVDVLLKIYNDPERDLKYHTYTLKEMERARDLYARE